MGSAADALAPLSQWIASAGIRESSARPPQGRGTGRAAELIDKLFSPKQVARALGVSESSLKRWCDRGLIDTRRTGGGHRRISLREVYRFLRQHDHDLVEPELLGLPAARGTGPRCVVRARDHLLQALQRGEEQACRDLVLDLYLSGFSIRQICDDVLTEVMRCVGQLWQAGRMQVYQERLGCEIFVRVLDDLREVIPQQRSTAPTAIGAAPDADPYVLPSRMVELALRESGWHAVALGGSLPFDTLLEAVREKKPRLLWLSVSTVASDARFLADYAVFCAQLPGEIVVVVGGRALTEPMRRRMPGCNCCDNLQQLVDYAATIWHPE